jgi:hypothetical protein
MIKLPVLMEFNAKPLPSDEKQTVMDTYYNNINNIICDFFKKCNLQLLDIFLVGSRAQNNIIGQNQCVDYDSIIIIRDALALKDLQNIRDQLQEEVNQIDKVDLYHFKLFSLDEFEKAKNYDGFRIYEFQTSYKSHLKTNYFSYNSISLDRFNFINSILLHEVNGFFTNPNISKDNLDIKVKKRVERNIQILNNENITPFCNEINYKEFCMENDKLFKQFTLLSNARLNYMDFLKTYFMRFRHEVINRKTIYFNNINILTNEK